MILKIQNLFPTIPKYIFIILIYFSTKDENHPSIFKPLIIKNLVRQVCKTISTAAI